jgi:membrane-associated protein
MFIVGFFVAMEKLNFVALPLVIMANTILSLAYYTISIKIKQNFLKNSKKLQKAEFVFLKYGKSSIFIARFLPALRMSISFVAGISQMDRKHFIIYTLYGYAALNILWFTVGYFSYLIVGNLKEVNFADFTLYSVGISIIFILVYLANNLFLRRIK